MKQINLPIAAKDSQKIDLSNTHVGTTDFFRPFLNYALETVPKDKINVAIKQAVQGYPLAGPNLGQFVHHLNSFFVPFRTIMSDWVNFITSTDCRYFNVFTSTGPNGEPVGANGTNLIVGKRQLVPQVSRTDLFYLFFPNYHAFAPEDYEVAPTTNAVNFLTWSVSSDAVGEQEFTPEQNPFVTKWTVSRSLPNLINYEKPDIKATIYFNNMTMYMGIFLTPLGRLMYQLIRSLGLKWKFGGYFKQWNNTNFLIADYAAEWSDSSHIHEFTALPILALYKCFIDWYVPSKFKNNYDQMMQTLSMLQYPFRPQTGFNTFFVSKPYPLLEEVILYTQYPNDYFTNAFLYPNGSNSGESTEIVIPDITMPSSLRNNVMQVLDSDVNTPVLSDDGTGGVTTGLTSYALRALRALNNYVRRNQIVGYRAIDRFLAHFGAKLDYTQTNRSIHIAGNSVEVFPNYTVAQADTYDGSEPSPENQQALLGGKAANIFFSNELKHDFETNEQGIFLVLSSVTPKVGYVQGIDRMFLHKKMDDFYTPEFDSLGVQAILKDELYSDVPTSESDAINHSGEIFGYAVRYAEYKYKQDDLSGDFVLPSRNAFLESLHTFRLFDKYPASINNEFLIGDGAEYDRIFMMSTSDYDHLQTVSQNSVMVFRHVDSAADVKDITDGSGQYMSTQIGGNHSLR